jgi:ferritin-like metal-binding protein YciE
MKLSTIDKLLEDQLKDLHSAETQLIKALPKMAKAASSPGLKEAFTAHLEETKVHAERLDQIGSQLDIKMSGKKCKAMEGLIKEGKEVLEADGPNEIIDLALIAAAQRVEHYEISAYGTARTLAEQLGHEDVGHLLRQTEDEEEAADTKLTSVATEVLPTAASGDEADDGDSRA